MPTRPEVHDPTWPYPLNRDDILYLNEVLYVALVAGDCDGSLRYTRVFLKGRQIAVAKAVAWLETQGGYCDCEVYMNVARPMATWVPIDRQGSATGDLA